MHEDISMADTHNGRVFQLGVLVACDWSSKSYYKIQTPCLLGYACLISLGPGVPIPQRSSTLHVVQLPSLSVPSQMINQGLCPDHRSLTGHWSPWQPHLVVSVPSLWSDTSWWSLQVLSVLDRRGCVDRGNSCLPCVKVKPFSWRSAGVWSPMSFSHSYLLECSWDFLLLYVTV